MTEDFQYFLRLHTNDEGKPFTQDSWAKAMGMGRTRLCQVLGNVEGRGGVTRPKVAKDIQNRFPKYAEAMLAILGWDKAGNRVGVEHSTGNTLARGPLSLTAGKQ